MAVRSADILLKFFKNNHSDEQYEDKKDKKNILHVGTHSTIGNKVFSFNECLL